jgi:hypothetical protein
MSVKMLKYFTLKILMRPLMLQVSFNWFKLISPVLFNKMKDIRHIFSIVLSLSYLQIM